MPVSKDLSNKISLCALSVTAFVVLLNPFGIASGKIDIDPYLPIRAEITNTANGRLLLLSSFDDFYSIQSNYDLRRETSEIYVERGYTEILAAASLGSSFFNQYLRHEGITHVLVPLSTFRRGEIRYRWGELGSIRVQLSEPYFALVAGTSGDFPVVLYKVLVNDALTVNELVDPSYALTWGHGIRGEFYQVIRSLTEKGMYSYEYGKTYESGLEQNWIFAYPRSTDGLPDIQEIAEFQYLAKSHEMDNVTAEVTLIAAYGPSAPKQIIRVIHNGVSTAHTVTASQPAVIKLKLRNGDKVRFSNVLPCRIPQTCHPGEEDWRTYCYGISDNQVRLESQP